MLQAMEHSEILLVFIKLPFVFKTFVLSIFEWPIKTGTTLSTLCYQIFFQAGYVLLHLSFLLMKRLNRPKSAVFKFCRLYF